MPNLIDYATVASAAGDSGEFKVTGISWMDFQLNVSKIEGGGPSLTVNVQEAADQAGPWTTKATFPAMTTVGGASQVLIPITQNVIQFTWTLTQGPATFSIAGNKSTFQPSLALADPGNAGALAADRSGHVPLVTAGAETRTLANPTSAGLELDLFMRTDGGDCVVTAAAAVNQAAETIMTFNDAGDFIRLVAIRSGANFRWRVAANDGVALS